LQQQTVFYNAFLSFMVLSGIKGIVSREREFRAQTLPRNANFRTAECQGLKTVARFVASRGKFMSGTVRSVAAIRKLAFRSILASGGWHSAVCLRAVCQEVIPVVAIRGI
jgi:hypothetical protein